MNIYVYVKIFIFREREKECVIFLALKIHAALVPGPPRIQNFADVQVSHIKE